MVAELLDLFDPGTVSQKNPLRKPQPTQAHLNRIRGGSPKGDQEVGRTSLPQPETEGVHPRDKEPRRVVASAHQGRPLLGEGTGTHNPPNHAAAPTHICMPKLWHLKSITASTWGQTAHYM